jgi:hypothetical protein
MRRRDLLWLALAAAGCGSPPKPLAEAFPREFEGWRRASLAPLPVERIASDIRRLGAREGARATYEGPARLDLTLYDMTNQKSAYAALRLQKETARSVPFYHGRFFGLAESATADHAALASFSRAFEKRLAAH